MKCFFTILYLVLHSLAGFAGNKNHDSGTGQIRSTFSSKARSVYTCNAQRQLHHDTVLRLQHAPVLHANNKPAASKSIDVAFSAFAFNRNGKVAQLQSGKHFSGIPIGQLLLFPNHYFW